MKTHSMLISVIDKVIMHEAEFIGITDDFKSVRKTLWYDGRNVADLGAHPSAIAFNRSNMPSPVFLGFDSTKVCKGSFFGKKKRNSFAEARLYKFRALCYV